jgi:hypothetical protein
MNREPAPISSINAVAPADLQRIVAKCLEKDAHLRYQHASDLREFEAHEARYKLGRTSRQSGFSAGSSRRRGLCPGSVAVAHPPLGPNDSSSPVQHRPPSSSAVVADKINDRVLQGFGVHLERGSEEVLAKLPGPRSRETRGSMGLEL